MKKILSLVLAVALCVSACLLTSCGGGSYPPDETGTSLTVEIRVRDFGSIVVTLDREAAPLTVNNFLSLVDSGFYDGLTFHRIIDGFMIQGGDPEGTGSGSSSQNVIGEFSANGWDNPIKHERGVISMARGNGVNTASCQFFICQETASHLDGSYAAFGKVVEGMDVVDKIVDKTCMIYGAMYTEPGSGDEAVRNMGSAYLQYFNGSVDRDYQPVIEYIRRVQYGK